MGPGRCSLLDSHLMHLELGPLADHVKRMIALHVDSESEGFPRLVVAGFRRAIDYYQIPGVAPRAGC